MSRHQGFIEQTTQAVKPLYIAHTHAKWRAAISGEAQDVQEEARAQAELMRFWADPGRFARARELSEVPSGDPLLDRLVKAILLGLRRITFSSKSSELI